MIRPRVRLLGRLRLFALWLLLSAGRRSSGRRLSRHLKDGSTIGRHGHASLLVLCIASVELSSEQRRRVAAALVRSLICHGGGRDGFSLVVLSVLVWRGRERGSERGLSRALQEAGRTEFVNESGPFTGDGDGEALGVIRSRSVEVGVWGNEMEFTCCCPEV